MIIPSKKLFTVIISAMMMMICIILAASSLVSAAKQCPEGQRAVQSDARIYSNGCGTEGLNIQMDGMEIFEKPCCDLHDVCYSLCGADRDECEKAFERCMDKHCSKASSSKQMMCKSAAQTFGLTKQMGGGAFNKAQEHYCQCLDENDAEVIADAYVPHAEKIYKKLVEAGKMDDAEAEEKIQNFREKVMPKYFEKKAEWMVMKNLFDRYPQAIESLTKEQEKKLKETGDL